MAVEKATWSDDCYSTMHFSSSSGLVFCPLYVITEIRTEWIPQNCRHGLCKTNIHCQWTIEEKNCIESMVFLSHRPKVMKFHWWENKWKNYIGLRWGPVLLVPHFTFSMHMIFDKFLYTRVYVWIKLKEDSSFSMYIRRHFDSSTIQFVFFSVFFFHENVE